MDIKLHQHLASPAIRLHPSVPMNTTTYAITSLPTSESFLSSWPGIILSVIGANIALILLYIDYQFFLSLGPGGTPSTPYGYAKIKLLSLLALREPLRPYPRSPTPGYLTSLPPRTRPRPKVAGIAPHRQVTQRATRKQYDELLKVIETIGSTNARLALNTSCFEHHSLGLFACDPVIHTCRGEIAHAHPSDGSMHTVLHPADANLVMAMGWGERHPLAKGGWFRRFVPEGFMMVYAPTGKGEMEVVREVLEAAAWFVTGRAKEEVAVTGEQMAQDGGNERASGIDDDDALVVL
ncbi:hypothetical protein LTR95_000846 [Oleoguttula sp. CCFEE 5521]